jgi:multicomponent Na+:H+ antiporter subunit E
MKHFWMLAFLVLIWCGFSNNFAFTNIVFGFLISAICTYLVGAKDNAPRHHIRIGAFLSLIGMIMVELVKSSLIVAWDVISLRSKSKPIIMHIDLACRNDVERTLVANLLSLTPGTLSIDLTPDKSQLIVHVMFGQDSDAVKFFIQKKLEPKVIRVFRHD